MIHAGEHMPKDNDERFESLASDLKQVNKPTKQRKKTNEVRPIVGCFFFFFRGDLLAVIAVDVTCRR